MFSPSFKKRYLSLSIFVLLLFIYSPFNMAYSNEHVEFKVKPSLAQELHTISLASSIEKTLKEHPSLQVFKFRQSGLQGQLQTQSLSPAYTLGFEVENFAGTGDFNALDQAEYTISLSSVLEMGGKNEARIGLVNSRSEQLKTLQKIEALNLLSEVTRRYIDILAAQARLSLAKEAELLATETLTEVQKRSNAGISPQAEISRALASMGNAKLVVASEQQQLVYRRMALAMMWNEKKPTFTHVQGSLYEFSHDIPFEKLYAKVEQNPQILMYGSESRIRNAELRLANTESSTNLQWSIGIRQMTDVNETALTAGFSMPLFSSKRIAGDIISAQASVDEVVIKRKATLLALRNQLYRAYANRQQAIFTATNLQESIIPTLSKALEETQIAYQRGLYSYLDYLSARQELIIARRAMIESASSALRYGTEIEQLIAEALPMVQEETLSPINKVLEGK
jgi:cobalt-zinc-cadmium efflux system outer membrane protein